METKRQTQTEIELGKFVEEMDKKLYIRQEKYGDSWVNCDIEFLEKKLLEEINEYLEEVKHVKKQRN